jgi:hypothetical protein
VREGGVKVIVETGGGRKQMAPGFSAVKVASNAIRDSLRAVALTVLRIFRLVLLTSINTDPMEVNYFSDPPGH